jgi:hypothetical protein
MLTATINVPAKHAEWVRERLDHQLDRAGELLLAALEPEVESEDPPIIREDKRKYQTEHATRLAVEALIAKERLGRLWCRPGEIATLDIDVSMLQEVFEAAWMWAGEDLTEADAEETALVVERIAWLRGLAEEGTIPWPAEAHAKERGMLV